MAEAALLCVTLTLKETSMGSLPLLYAALLKYVHFLKAQVLAY